MAKEITTEKILHLFEVRRLSVSEIARRLGITSQSVYYRLWKAGVRGDWQRRSIKTELEKTKLYELYLQSLSIEEIARKLQTNQKTVHSELERHGIPKRKLAEGRRYRCPELKDIKVGGTMLIKLQKGQPRYFGYLYNPAKKFGMKITIRKQNDRLYKLTRIA